MGNDRRHKDTLIVVLQNDRISLIDGCLQRFDQSSRFFSGEVTVILFIVSDELLGPRQNPRFGRGGPAYRNQRLRVAANLLEHVAKSSAGNVIAYGSDEIAHCADGCDVVRNVRGAAKGVLALANADYGDGGFGRNSINLSSQVHVEHRVSNYGDALALSR